MKKSTQAEKLVAYKTKKLERVYNKILDMDDSLRAKTSELTTKNHLDRSNRLRIHRLHDHDVDYRRDKSFRSSDRGFNIRKYGGMDTDIWHYDDVRKWFNKYQNEEPPKDSWDPFESQYIMRKKDG